MRPQHAPSQRIRTLRAGLRDAYLVLRETGPWLVAFAAVWLGLGLLIWRFDRQEPHTVAGALYVALGQLLFQLGPLPANGWLQLLFFVAPAVGLALVARGAFSAGLLIFDKRNRREAWQMALASTYRDHIIVCGLGKVGYRVVGQLLATGQEVVAVERAPATNEFAPLVMAQGVPLITGDARNVETLRAAGLDQARTVVCMINDDLSNLDIALTARAQQPEIRIVLRVFNDALAQKLQSAFGIKSAFSTSALAAPTFAAAAVNRDVTNALYVGGKFLTTQEVVVAQGGALDGRLVGTIEQELDISVLYRRNERGEDLRPRGDYRLTTGDTIVVIGTLQSLEQLAALNQTNARPHVPDAMRR